MRENLEAEEVKPYDASRSKSEQVEEMFDSIAPSYDFMNSAMSFGMHRRWRDRALALAAAKMPAPRRIIDLATGTGDVAIALARRFPEATVTGVDLSEGMLRKAREKVEALDQELASRIDFSQQDCLNLPYSDGSFDLATIAYGVRNFENLSAGLGEICRVLKEGGVCMILELSRPENRLTRLGYDLYSRRLIPLVGRLVSKDPRAYAYLPESIKAMPPRSGICGMLLRAGFDDAEFRSLSLGVVTIYTAVK